MAVLWKMREPLASNYASFISGPWRMDLPVCPVCGRSPARKTSPMEYEWDNSSPRRIGDFLWAGPGRTALTDRARDIIASTGAIVQMPHIALIRSESLIKTLGYEPKVFELLLAGSFLADVERSTISMKRECEHCRTITYEIDQDNPRFVVEDRIAQTLKLFCTAQLSGAMLCISDVKEAVEEAKLTNVEFIEIGETC